MRFSLFSVAALSSLFIGAMAAPATGLEAKDVALAPIDARGGCEVCDHVQGLLGTVKEITASISMSHSSKYDASISTGSALLIIHT